MKITDRLVGDHKTFRKMLSQIDVFADQRQVADPLVRWVELFKDHLQLHAWAEDIFYYPAVRAALPRAKPPLSPAYMDHLDKEHKTIDGYLDQLEVEVKHKPPVMTWPQTYALFSKGLLAHMRREEEELFPMSEDLLGAEHLETLSRNLESRRSEAPKVRLHTPQASS